MRGGGAMRRFGLLLVSVYILTFMYSRKESLTVNFLCVYIGKGLHSANNVAKVKPAIEKLMYQYEFPSIHSPTSRDSNADRNSLGTTLLRRLTRTTRVCSSSAWTVAARADANGVWGQTKSRRAFKTRIGIVLLCDHSGRDLCPVLQQQVSAAVVALQNASATTRACIWWFPRFLFCFLDMYRSWRCSLLLIFDIFLFFLGIYSLLLQIIVVMAFTDPSSISVQHSILGPCKRNFREARSRAHTNVRHRFDVCPAYSHDGEISSTGTVLRHHASCFKSGNGAEGKPLALCLFWVSQAMLSIYVTYSPYWSRHSTASALGVRASSDVLGPSIYEITNTTVASAKENLAKETSLLKA